MEIDMGAVELVSELGGLVFGEGTVFIPLAFH